MKQVINRTVQVKQTVGDDFKFYHWCVLILYNRVPDKYKRPIALIFYDCLITV